MTKRLLTSLITVLLIIALLSACTQAAPVSTATPQATVEPTPVATPEATATPEPTPTKKAFKYNPYAISQYGLDFLGDHYDDWHRVIEALYAGETEVKLESINSTKEFNHFRRAVGVFFTPKNLLYDFMHLNDNGPYAFDPETHILTIKYAYDHDEYLEKLHAYTELIESIFDQHVSDVDNQFETAKELFLYTSNTMTYVFDERLNVYDAITTNKGFCLTYSGMYQVLLWQAGIDVYMIRYGTHEWNVVYIDGESYHMDTTWAKPDKPLYYFAMSDLKCCGEAGHDPNYYTTDVLLPSPRDITCPDTQYDYYYEEHP